MAAAPRVTRAANAAGTAHVKGAMTLARDVRYGARALAKAPVFTLLAVAVLAAGIGATTAIFSLVDAVLLRPLPYRAPDRLMFLAEAAPDYPFNRVAPLNFVDWSEQNHAFESMAAVAGASVTLSTPSAAPEKLRAQAVTSAFFDVLGVAPVTGRTFLAADAAPGIRVVVVSEAFWKRRYGGEPGLVGRVLTLNGDPFTVVGVVPAAFQIFNTADVWTIFRPGRTPEQRQMHYLRVLGRLRGGVSATEARADMAGVAANIARLSPATNKGWGVTIQPLRDALMGDDRRQTSLVLGAVVALVLVMAAANVASLLLSRGVSRTRELGVRAALGATRRDLGSQLLIESLLLGACGGAAGLGLAWLALTIAPSALPADTLPDGITLALDARVAAFAVGLSILVSGLFGAIPAWHATTVSLTAALAAGSRGATNRAGGIRSGLVAVEIALAVILLAGAGLLLRTLSSLSDVDAGYRNSDVLTMAVSLPSSRYPTDASTGAFYEAVNRELAAIPGVRAASWSGSFPLDGFDIGQAFFVVGDPKPDAANMPTAHYQITGARFFDVFGIPIRRGRAFTAADSATSQPVCIVSEAFVRRFARGRDPLSLRVSVDAMGSNGPTPVVRQVIGVSRQIKEGPGDTDDPVQIYVPVTQNPWWWSQLAIATTVPPESVTAAVKAAVARIDRDEAVDHVRTMRDIENESMSRPRFRAALVGVFAALALVLASVGVFAVLAFSVHERTRELGVRAALGARATHLVRMVAGQALRLALVGAALGLLAAAGLSRYLTSLLFGVTPLDPVTFIAAPLVIGLGAIVAAVVPAVRAARIAPAVALRQE